jgi:hypothetical protein
MSPGCQQVLGLAGHALREHRRVLQQPQLVGGGVIALSVNAALPTVRPRSPRSPGAGHAEPTPRSQHHLHQPRGDQVAVQRFELLRARGGDGDGDRGTKVPLRLSRTMTACWSKPGA